MNCLFEINLLDYYTYKLFAVCTMESVVLRLRTRNSSGDEIANVNFLYNDIVHALKIQ